MTKKVLLGYAGSWAFGVTSFYRIERLKEKLRKNPCDKKARAEITNLEKMRKGTPVYVSKEEFEKLKEWEKMECLSAWL